MKALFVFLCIWISQTALAVNNIAKKTPPLDWNGAYIGVLVGSGAGQTHFSDILPSLYGDTVRTPILLGGGQIGYNWSPPSTPWVLSLEAAANSLSSNGTFTGMAYSGFFLSQNYRVRPKSIATFTGRIGTRTGLKCNSLVYIKGGPALIHNKIDIATNGLLPTAETTTSNAYSKWGVTVGGGIEYPLTSAWTLALEYNYLKFNDVSVPVPTSFFLDVFDSPPSVTSVEGIKSDASQHLHLFKLGLNYKFGADPCQGGNMFPFLSHSYFANSMHEWTFEGGVRNWFGKGGFQEDLGMTDDPSNANSLVSRLTYITNSHTNEIFGRLESPWRLFLKGYGSVGRNHLHGKMNDEDWIEELVMYSNTIHCVRGHLQYFTLDGGYDLFRYCDRNLGLFAGYNFYHEENTALGATQLANIFGPGLISTDTPVITEAVTWKSWRVGVNAGMELYPRLRLVGDIAYLPCARFRGHDVHLLRDEEPNQNSFEFGNGYGVQAEASLSYLMTNHWSVGVGGRYTAMWTKQDAFTNLFGGVSRQTLPSKTERYGGFLQLCYTFKSC